MYSCILLFTLSTVVQSYLVQYYLYTPENPNSSVLVDSNNASEYVQRGYDIQIFVHGWQANRNTEFYPLLKSALFSRGNYNIIEINYSDLSKRDYFTAVVGAVDIGIQVGDFILNLTKADFPLKSIFLIGHSLGGQIAGFVGKRIKNTTSRNLPRITALDPAGPFFDVVLKSERLCSGDAEVVFVIHTDSGVYGVFGNAGTTDVYPNNGKAPQPGCVPGSANCSHARSWQYFVNAVTTPESLLAVKCNSYSDLLQGKCNDTRKIDIGGNITLEDKGTYYMTTNSAAPFRSLIPAGK